MSLLHSNNCPDPLDEAGLVIWNEAKVGFLIIAVEQDEHFYVTVAGEVDAPCKVSFLHLLGQRLEALAVVWVEKNRLGVSEVLATYGLHEGLWNKLHYQLRRPIISFHFWHSALLLG